MGYIKHEVDSQGNDHPYYSTQTQLKISGYVIELRKYARDFFIGDRPKSFKGKTEDTTEEIKSYSADEIVQRRYYRAKRELHDYINCNAQAWPDNNNRPYLPIFITFTFRENIQNIKEANHTFTKFIQRFNYLVTGDRKSYLKYVVVIEFQKRGAIHYHALFFNLPFIENIKLKTQDSWREGFVQVKSIRNIGSVARYMSKYMSKRFDDPRLSGKKCYFVSRGLKKPKLVYYDSLISQVLNYLPKEAVEFERTDLPAGDYMKWMDFTRYNLSNFKEEYERAIAFLESTGYDGPGYEPPKVNDIPVPHPLLPPSYEIRRLLP